MKRTYTESDANLALLAAQTVDVVGFGTQGMAQALNMCDSGLRVIVGEEPGSQAWARDEDEGFTVLPIEAVAGEASIFDLQVPDMAFRLADAYNQKTRGMHQDGDLICLSSAFNYYYGYIVPPSGVDAIVTAQVAGISGATGVRRGQGVPGLLAIHQDASGQGHARGLALCKALGFTGVGVQDTTIEEETVTDLLGEHCAWGATVSLLRAVYDVMVEGGYDPKVAFFEAVNESKLTTDLIYRYGLAGMLERISNTAAYSAVTTGPKIVDERVKDNIRWAMENTRNGGFDRDWEQDYKRGYPKFRGLLEEIRNSQAEQVGNEIRRRRDLGEAGGLTATNL